MSSHGANRCQPWCADALPTLHGRHSSCHVDVVQECHEPFSHPQLSIGSHKSPVLPQAEKHWHEGVPLFTTLSLEYVHVPTPSTGKMVDRGSNSERPCTTCATHSVPAHAESAHWNGCVAPSAMGVNCCAIVRATSLRNTSPTTIPRTPPSGLVKAVIRPTLTPCNTSRLRTALPPLRTTLCTWCLAEGVSNAQRSSRTDLPLHLFEQCASSSTTNRRRS